MKDRNKEFKHPSLHLLIAHAINHNKPEVIEFLLSNYQDLNNNKLTCFLPKIIRKGYAKILEIFLNNTDISFFMCSPLGIAIHTAIQNQQDEQIKTLSSRLYRHAPDFGVFL